MIENIRESYDRVVLQLCYDEVSIKWSFTFGYFSIPFHKCPIVEENYWTCKPVFPIAQINLIFSWKLGFLISNFPATSASVPVRFQSSQESNFGHTFT